MKKILSALFIILITISLSSCKENVAPHKHEYVLHEAVKPDCTKSGNYLYYTCTGCDKLFNVYHDEWKESPLRPQTDHSYLKIEFKESTYIDSGLKEGYQCVTCLKTFDTSKKEVDISILDIPVKEYEVSGIASASSITINTSMNDFLNKYHYADIVDVTINNKVYSLPIVDDVAKVDEGSTCVLVNEAIVAIAANGTNYLFNNIPVGNIQIKMIIGKQSGYKEEYILRGLYKYDDRNQYSSDQIFANFREILVTGMKSGVLYRSASLLDESIGRNSYADRLAMNNLITSFVDLEDSYDEMISYPYYNNSFCGTQDILNAKITKDYNNEETKSLVKNIIEYISLSEDKVLIFSKDGISASTIIALIELSVGANRDEVLEDYAISYINIYGISTNDEAYTIVKNKFLRELTAILGDLTKNNALAYFRACGISEKTLEKLQDKIES